MPGVSGTEMTPLEYQVLCPLSDADRRGGMVSLSLWMDSGQIAGPGSLNQADSPLPRLGIHSDHKEKRLH